jgi:quinol-cytochrome oxidoreductase complex cytochrome b subunit
VIPGCGVPVFFLAVFLGVLGGLARDLYWIAVGENAVAQQVVDRAFRVHTSLGPGLLESVNGLKE